MCVADFVGVSGKASRKLLPRARTLPSPPEALSLVFIDLFIHGFTFVGFPLIFVDFDYFVGISGTASSKRQPMALILS